MIDQLEQLEPPIAWTGDWSDVLTRAGVQRRNPRGRRALVAALALATVLTPLVAIAAVNDWWFLGGDLPKPIDKPVVVTEGSWNGRQWKLVAYNSQTDGTCWSITFVNGDKDRGGSAVTPGPGAIDNGGSALSCGAIVGVHLPHIHEDLPTVEYLITSNGDGSVRGIAGPVVSSAATVQVRFENGVVFRLPTVAPPSSLGSLRWFGPVRFFVGQLPARVQVSDPLHSITGFAANGKIVACLIYGKRYSGPYSRPSDCAED